MTEDASDLSAAQRGGPDGHAAFSRLYDRHAPVVLALCRHHAPPPPESPDDALQETFIRAFRLLDTLGSPDHLRPWLYGIARRVCSERRRAARRRRNHEHRAAAMNHAVIEADAQTATPASPPADASRTEQLARLSRALDHLTDEQRLAIHLYYLDTDPVAAATTALGVTRSGFYKLLSRARMRLASVLKEAPTP